MGSEEEEAYAQNNNKVICAICYEEAKPAFEDLQSISLCGHVFHELCLQQWLEYCPRGRKCTCPLCKQQCSVKDVHRLYFQSASETTQASQGNCTALPYACDDDVKTLQATVQKLTGQLSVTKSSLEVHQKQLQEANRQLSACTGRVEKAESAQLEAQREKSSLKEALLRTQEELKRSMAERSKLLEKNTSLTKELALNNLAQNLDVDEDDVARMARVGCGNKDDVIGTLTRCLIVRNRAYKDLMVKCNALGTGENKALRKYAKAFERVKALKVRVQELERLVEDKENGDLRLLKKSSKLGSKSTDLPVATMNNSGTSLLALKSPLSLRPSSEAMQNSATSNEPIKISNAAASLNVNRNACILLEEEKEIRLLVSEEAGVSENNSIQNVSPPSSPKDTSKSICSSFNRSAVTELSKISLLEGGIRQGCEVLSSAVENDSVLEKAAFMMEMDPCSVILSESHIPVTIRKEVRYSTGMSDTGTTASIRDKTPSKWCKQSSSWGGDSSSGTFITCGANGRGGQLKVLRPPPMLRVGEVSRDNWLRPVKKLKSSRNLPSSGNQQGSLQIEHFFGGCKA